MATARFATENNDYEDIDYEYFPPVPWDRYMSWKTSSEGTIVASQTVDGGTDANGTREDVTLDKGLSVFVRRTKFKLVPQNPEEVEADYKPDH